MNKDMDSLAPEAEPGLASQPSTGGRKVLVAVATYNEIANLPIFVRRLREILPEVDLLVIDDGSPDGTGQWCDEQMKADPHLRCLHRQGKLGLGTAIIAAMQYAIKHEYDVLVNLDADLSHPPEMIPPMLAAQSETTSAEADSATTVVLGSRYVPGGGIEGWPLKRHIMSRAINLYSRILLKLPIKDCSGSIRVYPVPLLKRIEFDSFLSHGYSFFEEILHRLNEQGARFVEYPFVFVERQYGRSKINMREARKAVWVIFRLGLRVWRPF